jgi:hypothetical protein
MLSSFHIFILNTLVAQGELAVAQLASPHVLIPSSFLLNYPPPPFSPPSVVHCTVLYLTRTRIALARICIPPVSSITVS